MFEKGKVSPKKGGIKREIKKARSGRSTEGKKVVSWGGNWAERANLSFWGNKGRRPGNQRTDGKGKKVHSLKSSI